MNLELLDQFGQSYPEVYDGSMDSVSQAITCQFNKWGSLLAVGCNDGRIVIWDFVIRGIAKVITAHIHPVCSLSWSRDGRRLLSASTDNTISIWTVLTGGCENTYRLPMPIMKAAFHPRKPEEFLVSPLKHQSVIMKLDGTFDTVPLPEGDTDVNIISAYSRRGEYVFSGNCRGRITIFSREDFTQLASFVMTVSSAVAVKSMVFPRRGGSFVVNGADRVLRVYDCAKVIAGGREPEQRLQDLVNKTMWKTVCYSGDGEFICGGSARQHSLHIWERVTGNLVKMLWQPGQKGELLLDVAWHPARPIIASVASGLISVWSQNHVENWSAFAPDFTELEENVVYEERESEFDLADEDASERASLVEQPDEIEVDVCTVAPVPAFLDSDEEMENPVALLFLPVSPDIESPESTAVDDRPAVKDVKLEVAPGGESHPLLGRNKPDRRSRVKSDTPSGKAR